MASISPEFVIPDGATVVSSSVSPLLQATVEVPVGEASRRLLPAAEVMAAELDFVAVEVELATGLSGKCVALPSLPPIEALLAIVFLSNVREPVPVLHTHIRTHIHLYA